MPRVAALIRLLIGADLLLLAGAAGAVALVPDVRERVEDWVGYDDVRTPALVAAVVLLLAGGVLTGRALAGLLGGGSAAPVPGGTLPARANGRRGPSPEATAVELLLREHGVTGYDATAIGRMARAFGVRLDPRSVAATYQRDPDGLDAGALRSWAGAGATADLLATGRPSHATILTVHPLTELGSVVAAEAEVDVQLPDGGTRRVRSRGWTTAERLGRVLPGTRVPVRIDPGDTGRVALDWTAI